MLGDFGENVARRIIGNLVGRIEPEAVDVKLTHPIGRVLREEGADRSSTVIQRRTPRRVQRRVHVLVVIDASVVAVGAEVVVDDVENDRESERVRRIDQRAQIVGRPVGARRGVKHHAVVTPISLAGKIADRHQLDRIDAQRDEMLEPLDRYYETCLRR